MDDFSRIEEFQKGDPSAFELLLLKYQHRIYTLCRYLLQDPYDAEDAAQETFVKAFQGLKRFTPAASFYTWLYRIAVNTCLDHRRKASVRAGAAAAGGNDVGDAVPSADPSPESAYEKKEAQEAFQAALNRLSEKLQIPLVLREVEGLSYEEIAAALDVSVGTVKSRISRAREEIARVLKIPRNKTRGDTLKKIGEKP
ncbi:MAG: sigma-70 family RNA polymerase sigma factor [Candidatus Deferrimicrobiaceae bacterium]